MGDKLKVVGVVTGLMGMKYRKVVSMVWEMS